MSEFTICPVNWASFQHYKDRSPAWIKLHRSMILDNPKWHRLPLASKAIAPSIWLLASEGPDGEITSTMEDLAFRLRVSEKEAKAALIPLIEANFFTLVHDASGVLAECLQGASGVLAQRREEENREEEETDARDENEKVYWFSSNSHPILKRIIQPLLNVQYCGKQVFLPESFSETSTIKLCDRIARIEPEEGAIEGLIAELHEYCSSKRSRPYSDPVRTLGKWLDIREPNWLELKRSRSRNGFVDPQIPKGPKAPHNAWKIPNEVLT